MSLEQKIGLALVESNKVANNPTTENLNLLNKITERLFTDYTAQMDHTEEETLGINALIKFNQILKERHVD